MKRLLPVLCIALLASGSAFAQGIDKGQFEVSLGGGLAMPMGDFSDFYGMGFFGGLNTGYYATPQIVIGAEGQYYMYSAKDEFLEAEQVDDSTITDIKWTTISGAVYGKYLFKPENMSPYVKAQVGMYSNKVKVEADVESDVSESDIGIAGGAGIQFKGQGNIGGFGEALFHNVMTEGSSTQFITIRAGVTFFLGKK